MMLGSFLSTLLVSSIWLIAGVAFFDRYVVRDFDGEFSKVHMWAMGTGVIVMGPILWVLIGLAKLIDFLGDKVPDRAR